MAKSKTTPRPSLETYLGTAPANRIGDLIVQRFKAWRASMAQSAMWAQWQRNYSQYHNGPAEIDTDEPWSSGYDLEGENSEVLAIRINEMRNLITHVLNLTYSKPIGRRAIAENGEASSLQAADVADALLDEDFRSSGGSNTMRRAGEGALVVSTSFVMAEWDFSGGEEYLPPGEVDPNNPDAPPEPEVMTGEPKLVDFWVDEVCFDKTKKNWRDVYDVVLLRRYNRFEIASRANPEHMDKIMNAPSITQSPLCGLRTGDKDDESDDIFVFEYLHRKINGRLLPDGRRTVCLEDGTVLDDGPNPYAGMKHLNVHPVTAAQGLGSVYGYAAASDLSPINQFVNLLATVVATNVAAHGAPNIVGPKLNSIDISNVIGGARYFGVNPNQEIKSLDLMPDLSPFINLMGTFSGYGEKLTGLAGVMRGEDSSNMSGVAIAQVKSMAVQFVSSFQQSVVEQHEELFNDLIWLRKNLSTGPQKVAKLGGDNTQEVLEYDAQQTLGQIARVRAEAIDPVMNTPEGREARADKIMNMGGFEAPWEYLTFLKTGQDSVLFKGPMAKNMLIQRENSAMIRGKLPLVLQQDDHEKHETEHLALLADPGVRENDGLVQIVLEHNARHTLYRMGLNVMQGVDQSTGQPFPSAIVQLEQAKAMAQQQQAMAPPQGNAPASPDGSQQGAPQGQPAGPQPMQAGPTIEQSLQQGAMEPQPN